MTTELPGGISKWEAARVAVGDLTRAFEDTVDFGLQVFPFPLGCFPGVVNIDVGSENASEIAWAMVLPPPVRGNYTPMAETLGVAALYEPLTDGTRSSHVILVTDGWQYCAPHDESTRFDPVRAVSGLRAFGVTVHVVGFGAEVDSLVLNRAAVAAGTELPGCDASLEDPEAENHCYHRADSLEQLRTTLHGVARDISDEQCDGFDNDCDGTVDEGFDLDEDGYTVCGTIPGDAGGLDEELVDCADDAHAIHPGAEEICDELDNDCDGVIDPGCECLSGRTQPCGISEGICRPGTQVCTDGRWDVCLGAVAPMLIDGCDGLDEDCDGRIDEEPDCPADMICQEGACVDLLPPATMPPVGPPEEEFAPIAPPQQGANCGCAVPGSSTGGQGFGFVALLALLLWRKRPQRA